MYAGTMPDDAARLEKSLAAQTWGTNGLALSLFPLLELLPPAQARAKSKSRGFQTMQAMRLE